MTDKQKYWIRDSEGVYAQVDGSEQRDLWTKVRGWSEADEPSQTDQVHVTNEHPEIGPGRLPYGALEGWSGYGWAAGPPPEPVSLFSAAKTTSAPVDDAAKPIKAAAPAAGEKKE